jgi:diacylglycerol kinase (ATP)
MVANGWGEMKSRLAAELEVSDARATPMRKAAVLFNARSGGRRNRRESDLEEILTILTGAGVEAGLVRTQSSLDAAEQARQAIANGCDTVFACGGDGTVHDVLQGMAGSRAALAVIPMGTANALAHDLRLPRDPARAARASLRAQARRIALGRVTVNGPANTPVTRYFTVTVGVGVDAHLFYKLQTSIKQRLGMAAYYAKAWHLWCSHRMAEFQVELANGPDQAVVHSGVTEMLAVRIKNFGGVLQELAPGASLQRDDLRVVLCHSSSRMSYLAYVIRGMLGVNWKVPGVELAFAKALRCTNPPSAGDADACRVYVEADGELVGTLPAEISIVPDALTILAPTR